MPPLSRPEPRSVPNASCKGFISCLFSFITSQYCELSAPKDFNSAISSDLAALLGFNSSIIWDLRWFALRISLSVFSILAFKLGSSNKRYLTNQKECTCGSAGHSSTASLGRLALATCFVSPFPFGSSTPCEPNLIGSETLTLPFSLSCNVVLVSPFTCGTSDPATSIPIFT
uniref:Uncharacterized protein n=1 Tax=Opuntia streptacantha TaxID=393608 RepID=A0A7C9AXE7_OPUST